MENKAKILLIDDNPELLKLYTQYLMREGFYIDRCDNVKSAIEQLKKDRYDVIVLDLIIPGLDRKEEGGLDVIDEALKIDPLIQIIVITAYPTIERFKKILDRGAVDFVDRSQHEAKEELIDRIELTLIKKAKKIRQGNPFIPQSSRMPQYFGGRVDAINFLEDRLARPFEHFIVLGEWGIGKSTLLKKYKEIVNEKNMLGVYVTVVEFTDKNDLRDGVNSIIQGIFREIPFATSKLKKMLGYFESIGINILGTGLDFTKATKTLQPESILYDTLKELWEDIKERGLLLILLDDVQNFSSISSIFSIFKQILEGTPIKDLKILFGLSCTTSHWKLFTDLNRHSPISRTFFKKMILTRLTKEELEDAIINSLRDTSVIFSQEIIDKVYEHTQGHPFEMQALCQKLFDSQIGGRVDDQVWEKSLQQTLMDMGEFIFEHWYRKISDRDKSILKIFANAHNPLSIKEIQHIVIEQNINLDVNSILDCTQGLIDVGLLNYFEDSNELLEIPDKMFKSYISFFKTSK